MNQQLKLASRPKGTPQSSDFLLESSPVPELKDGEVLVKTIYISIDPAMRGWMNEGKSYVRPVEIGEVFRAVTAGKVIASKHPDFTEGQYVTGIWGVQEYAVAKAKELVKVDAKALPLTTYIATLGMPGLTAYFGLLDSGQPKEGETVLVSGAAGAVGSVVGQIAKIKGCKVIGVAGGEDKCNYCVNELGFDACINYQTEDVRKALKAIAPEGIDIYFDNIGGDLLDIALQQIRFKARIVICGAISQYNNTEPVKGPANYLSLLVNRARMEGIVVFDNTPRYGEAIKEMAGWLIEGKLQSKVQIEKGIENFHPTLLKLFSGKNFGKLILQVGEE